MINIIVCNVVNSMYLVDCDLCVVLVNLEFEIFGCLECIIYGLGNYVCVYFVCVSFGM